MNPGFRCNENQFVVSAACDASPRDTGADIAYSGRPIRGFVNDGSMRPGQEVLFFREECPGI